MCTDMPLLLGFNCQQIASIRNLDESLIGYVPSRAGLHVTHMSCLSLNQETLFFLLYGALYYFVVIPTSCCVWKHERWVQIMTENSF